MRFFNACKNSGKGGDINFKFVSIILCVIYVGCVIGFYFIADDRLYYRESPDDIPMVNSEGGSIELSQGTSVEQIFYTDIQRLESVSVQWGTWHLPNSGTVYMELRDVLDDTILMYEKIDIADIQEGQVLTMRAPEPLETTQGRPLVIRLYSDAEPGLAITPLVATSVQLDDQELYFNTERVIGTLCFSAQGTERIWIGFHYWELTIAGFLALSVMLLSISRRVRMGKRSYVINALTAMKKYRFLIHQLVSRDFKTKYKRSILGVLWSFLNPLLMLCVQYFVFSTIFKNDVENFVVYLLIGVVMFNFFSESCGMSLTSILGNAGLITKVYVPKYVYPLTRTMSSVVNLLISLIPLVIMCLLTGVHFTKAVILAPFFLICLVVFCLGLGLLLSASMVFFRDTQFLWNVLSMMWMYATPIFYPESILPDNYKFVLQINPLYYFIQNTRICILDGISPEPFAYVQCFLIAIGMLLFGAFVFNKNQDKFVLYL